MTLRGDSQYQQYLRQWQMLDLSLNEPGTSPSAQGALTAYTDSAWLHKKKHFPALK